MDPGLQTVDHTLARSLRAAGLVTLAMVCTPVLVHGGIDPRRLAAWAIVSIAFAVAFAISASGPIRGGRWVLLAVESACVSAMAALLCDGFEGSLLVLVALQLGRIVGWRAGVPLIGLQTMLLAGAIAFHWALAPALLLAPPYLGFQLLAFVLARLLTHHENARRDLAKANAELSEAKGVAEENSRLAERLRIARELHDAVGHRLTALSLHLEVAARTAEGAAREACKTAQSLARDALSDVRQVVSSLRENDRTDLVSALFAMAAEIPSPQVHVVAPKALRCADASRALTVLRCAQEIMTNAARHAQAGNLWIELMQEGEVIQIVAEDDGRGAASVSAGAGLRGMRERIEEAGGRLDVTTAPGQGFTLRARVPTGGT